MVFSSASYAQFYHGMHHPFGKNRIQYEKFLWKKYQFPDFTVFFNGDGQNLAVFTAQEADLAINEIERFFDYPVRGEHLQFVVYEKLEHFRQSNVGIPETDESNIGGITQIAGNKIFVYYNGDLNDLKRQVRKGVSEVLIAQMLFGDNWREMLKNTALLNFPEWYIEGLTWYATEPWNVDVDDQLRDIVQSGKYQNFNRLKNVEAEIAGRSLWYYIGETYGSKVVPNIMYMARVSRNVESGFMFVLGISLATLIEDANVYFEHRYNQDTEGTQEFDSDLDVRLRRNRDYAQIAASDDGRYVAYTSNQLSKTKVWIYDSQADKRKGYVRHGYKLERVNDLSYPIIDWNDARGRFMVIQEEKGQLWLYQIDPQEGVELKTEILRLEKVLDMEVSDDGKSILFSAIKKGQSDIFLYSVAARSQKQLTDDVYDDRYPAFWGNQVVFSSNRTSDAINISKDHLNNQIEPFYDLYSLPTDGESEIAKRLTNTPDANETHANAVDATSFLFLSDKSGIRNRYRGNLDSTILSIDTNITYRYFTNTEPLTGYKRNIAATDYSRDNKVSYDLYYIDGKYHIQKVENSSEQDFFLPPNSNYRMGVEAQNNPRSQSTDTTDNGIKFIRIKVFENDEGGEQLEDQSETSAGNADDGLIDIANYTFDEGAEDSVYNEVKSTNYKIQSPTEEVLQRRQFKIPEQRNYKLAFSATDLTTQFDFDYATDLYQPFNGGPYLMPGMGTFIRIGMLDLFEDYKLEGGFRYSFNRTGTEYYIALEDRSKRLDKKYIVQRQSLIDVNRTDSIQRTYLYQARGIFRYPLSEVSALQFTATGRYDRVVTEAVESGTLTTPDRFTYFAGLKAEYIFDNTLVRGLNILNGARAKVFAEHYRDVIKPNTGFSVVGFDGRHYQKIHRDLIWANRLAGSSSFGQRRLVYYMGSVDNWIVLTERERFDNTTNVPRDQGYAFQTIATNMRGFIQNARNGNNFMVLNSELRWPVVRYFTDKPIKSEFLANFQIIGFGDIGSAWNGPNPYSDENAFNNITVTNGAVTVSYQNQNDPIIGGLGWGLRTKIWGYFVRFDYAYGIENGLFLNPVTYLSFGLDF